MTQLLDLPNEILLEIIDHIEQNAAYSFWIGSVNLGYTCNRLKSLTNYYQERNLAKYYKNNKFWDYNGSYEWDQ